jgi:YHS domain-containing protein
MKTSIFIIILIVSGFFTVVLPKDKSNEIKAQSAKKAQAGNPRTKHFRLGKNNVAIDGYDPVSYFKSGPQKGRSELSFNYNGVVYQFASTGNLNEFKSRPDVYEPAFGGWCGYAMALRGEKVEINPECYKIINGRNVLFFKSIWANALTNWEKEIQKTPENTLMSNGDAFWNRTITP